MKAASSYSEQGSFFIFQLSHVRSQLLTVTLVTLISSPCVSPETAVCLGPSLVVQGNSGLGVFVA